MPEARDWLLDRVVTPATVGPALMDRVRELCTDLYGETLARFRLRRPQGRSGLRLRYVLARVSTAAGARPRKVSALAKSSAES